MTTDGIRLTHRDPAEIGKPYLGTIGPGAARAERSPRRRSEPSGPSLRSVVPVIDDGEVVALVSAGITLGSVGSGVLRQVPFVIAIAVALAAVGLAAAWLAGRFTRRIAGDLPASAVRDAVSSYESVRTLGEALRAQTHEHGNRMHTAVALLELGRTDEAIGILTETSRQSQALVDQVAARREGDPTVGALLLGKAAQARERGVEWTAQIDPAAPRSTLSPVDAVSVVGNLIDNAVDAAAAGSEPRTVRRRVRPRTGRRPRDLGLGLRRRGAARTARSHLRARLLDQARGRRGPRRRARARPLDRGGGRRRRRRDRRPHDVPGHPAREERMIQVLLVDDDALTLELHRTYLERLEGFRVVAECTGARAAVSAILERPPAEGIDLVLLDMTMPDGTGLDVLRHVRARAADVDVIAVTGVRDADVVRQMVALGVAQYLIKPFAFAVFRERLEQYRAYRERARDASGPATQSEIDAMLSALRPSAPVALPKGLSADTLERVTAAVRTDGPLSAAETATRLGMSRVAARRYLEHLADAARVERSPRYGSPGRPETEYRWRG